MILPQDYIVQKFYQYAGSPRFKRLSNTYEASCPICREGRSWGKKRRCYYIVENNAICCHNCGWYSNPSKWIQEVSGLSLPEIIDETKNYDVLPLDILKDEIAPVVRKNTESLPADSINLFDKSQLLYYSNNAVVKDALNIIKNRKLDTAVNRPDTLWISLVDPVHKNRLVIPFYSESNDIIFYQTRAIYDKDMRLRPKYLSKINGERSLYNINKVSAELDYIFIFEGPINSFFVKNGTAVAGIQEDSYNTFTPLQERQISQYKFHKRIWVLDSQWIDKASRKKTEKLVNIGESVFIWPESKGKQYKDINDLCIAKNINQLDPEFLICNSHSDLKAKLVLSVISR